MPLRRKARPLVSGVAATEDSRPDLPPGTEPSGREGTASGVPMTEDLTPGVAATEGSEPDVSPGTEQSGSLPDTEPRAEGAPSGTGGEKTSSPGCRTKKISPRRRRRSHPMLKDRQAEPRRGHKRASHREQSRSVPRQEKETCRQGGRKRPLL